MNYYLYYCSPVEGDKRKTEMRKCLFNNTSLLISFDKRWKLTEFEIGMEGVQVTRSVLSRIKRDYYYNGINLSNETNSL